MEISNNVDEREWPRKFFEWLGEDLWIKWRYYSNYAITDLEPSEYFWSAFTWADTEEGHTFWSDLSYEWEEIVEENF